MTTTATRLAPDDSYRWVVLGAAVLAQTTASIVSQGVYTLVPFFQAAFHLTQASAALAVSAVNGGQVLSMLMLGWLIDKYGERSVVAVTMVAMGLAAFASALSPGYHVLLMFLVLLGGAYASVQPGGTRAVLRWFPPAQRGMATGIRQAGLPLGTAMAAMVLPALAVQHGWQSAVMVQGVVGVLGGLAFAVFHRDDRGVEGGPAAVPPPSLPQLVRVVAQYSALWPVMLAGVAMVTFQYTFATHVLSFLTTQFKMSIVAAALLYSVSQWVGIAGRIGLAWISDRLWPNRRVRSLAWTMAICALSVVAFMLLPSTAPVPLLVGVFVVIGVFGVGWYPLYLLQVAEMAPKSGVASTISFSMTLNMAAISVVPPLFGLVVDFSGYQAAWLVLVVMLALSMVHLMRGAARAEAARLSR
jgi:MFS family permease